ncbi:hypothetical protein KTC96_21795 [Clostridium estertheticum]|nr:hypothetical protein [Clostridium estertheticum]MBX4260712.1 hypothetical protein [Clostridium estertheticum]WLC70418.1 hypothetical protein KTC96_21795 [Clostridium estertheticum]
MVTNQSLTRLKDLIGKDNTVDCFVPYEALETTVSNVMGYLKARTHLVLQ